MAMWGVCPLTEGIKVKVKVGEVLGGESLMIVECMMVITQQLWHHSRWEFVETLHGDV